MTKARNVLLVFVSLSLFPPSSPGGCLHVHNVLHYLTRTQRPQWFKNVSVLYIKGNFLLQTALTQDVIKAHRFLLFLDWYSQNNIWNFFSFFFERSRSDSDSDSRSSKIVPAWRRHFSPNHIVKWSLMEVIYCIWWLEMQRKMEEKWAVDYVPSPSVW